MAEDLLIKIGIMVVGALTTFCLGLIAWGIKALITAILKNTTELAVLNSKIEVIIHETEDIPEIKKDLQVLHSWKRKVQDKLDNQGDES